MRLLFITRKYPPAVGGMENLSFALSKEFEKNVFTKKITWGKSQKYLPYFLPKAFAQALYYINKYDITHIHLGDALLSPLGLALKRITGKKVSVTACGLDITYKNKLYQALIPNTISQLDKIICISTATLNECLKRGVPSEKCVVVPCGVYQEKFVKKASKEDLEKLIGLSLKNKKVLITVGRLVKRKGVSWFVNHIAQRLPEDYVYLVIGDGPERRLIEKTISEKNLHKKVLLLGKIPDEDLKTIYNTADLFVMPNIPIQDDMEGFGIVAIEASSTGLPVIASNLEGIRDAVIDQETGYLVNPEAPDEFINKINKVSNNPIERSKITSKIQEMYSWPNIIKNYVKTIS